MTNPKHPSTFPAWPGVLGTWLVWRLGLLYLGSLADKVLLYKPSFPYFETLPLFGWPRWLYSWANFDGIHYLTITQVGYVGTGLIQAFFPVTALLMAGIHHLTHLDLFMSGFWLNQAASLVTCLLLWSWLKSELGERAARWGLVWWLVFPTVFFTGAIYSEATFLALSLGCWLAARKGHWWLAGLLGMFASATRVMGILLLPMLFLELLAQTHWSWHIQLSELKSWWQLQWPKVLAISLTSLGLLSYMGYLWFEFHDPLFFLHQQAAFGGGRQESLVLWLQVVWRSIHILLTARPFDWKYLIYVEEFVVGIGSVAILIWGWWHRKRTHLTTPLAVYSLGCILMPTFTGTFLSLPRYVLSAWPLWLVLIAWSRSSRWAWLGVVFSLALLIINTVLFIQGYWVA